MNERQQNRDRPAAPEGQIPGTVEPMPEAMTAEADGREAPKNLTGRPGSAGFESRDEVSSPQAPDSGENAPVREGGRKAGGENSLPASDEPARAESEAKKRCAPVRLILWGWGLLTAPSRLGEILRFCLVGGVATLIDFAVMALLLWAFEPEAYPTFWDLFTGGDPSPLVSAVASALGFLSGHIFNYTASVRFVFRDNARGRTKKGFVVFTLIALFCLLLHAVGMYACRALFELNEWLVKAVLTVLVTALGYVLKKKILF